MRLATCVVLGSLAFGLTVASAQDPASPDAIDEAVRIEMQKRRIPGLSLAIIQDGKIVKAKGYGVAEKGGETAVTPDTLFQAGSISKPVSALGALHLVEQGKLALDEDVNAKLTTWKVPENEFTQEKPVTLRGILSHTAGLTVHGFPGYATDEAGPHPGAGPRRREAREHAADPGGHPPRQRGGGTPAAATRSCSRWSST